jgi:hypothetical protein
MLIKHLIDRLRKLVGDTGPDIQESRGPTYAGIGCFIAYMIIALVVRIAFAIKGVL